MSAKSPDRAKAINYIQKGTHGDGGGVTSSSVGASVIGGMGEGVGGRVLQMSTKLQLLLM